MPKKPKHIKEDNGFKIGKCPECGEEVDNSEDQCPYCRIELNWDE